MTSSIIPSVQLDQAVLGQSDATAGAQTSNNAETFALSDGLTLFVSVDGGGAQTATFNIADFDTIGEATAAEVIVVLLEDISGATSTAETGGEVTITSDTFGTSSSIEITGGTAATIFDFPSGADTGTDATGYDLINRIPEPGETEVDVDSTIQIDVFSVSGSAPASSLLTVYIEDVLAYEGDGTGFQAGFDGTESDVTLVAGSIRRITIDPTTTFDPLTTVSVRVVVGGTPDLDETYTYTTWDTISPGIETILATDKNTIRVTFTEPVLMVSSSNSNDALNITNYTIDRNPVENTPAVDVEVTTITAVSTSVVDITTDIELTFGQEYLLTIENVEDLHSNIISGVLATDIAFDAFSPAYSEDRSFALWDMMPLINRIEDTSGDLARTIACWQEIVNVLLAEIDAFEFDLDPNTCSSQHLDALLYDLGNPFAFADLGTNDKRKLVQTLVSMYKLKGTAQGIIDVIEFFIGIVVEVHPWITQYGWVLGNATQAILQSANSETFALVDAMNLKILVDGDTQTDVVFSDGDDFVDIGNATAAEVAAVITTAVTGVTAGAMADGTVLLQRDAYGSGTSIKIVEGTANAILGFSLLLSEGTGTDSSIISELGVTSYLRVHEQAHLYSYTIESPEALTTDQRTQITQIAEYMQPGHTHLVGITEP
jgi:phage tail-like protein